MNFRSKSAAAAGLFLFSCTAAIASGVSNADETIPTVPAQSAVEPVQLNSDTPRIESEKKQIVFAPAKEVVQPIDGVNSSTAVTTDPLNTPRKTSLAAMVRATDTSAALDADTHCLATAVFYEARSESLEGQLAVARVIINRSHSPRFANSLCAVILQPKQFSFVRGGRLPAPKTRRPAWKTAVAIARIAQNNGWESEAEGALYFHARYVAPAWRKRAKLAVIDNHIFYR